MKKKRRKAFRHLEAYKKVWDDRLGCYKNTPLHDEHSHAADAFRYLAVDSKALNEETIAVRKMI